MEKIAGQMKWTTTNHTEGWSSSKEGDVMYMAGLVWSPLLWILYGKPDNSSKYCAHRDQGWEVLTHPMCSPDVALSDFDLFQSIQNYLNGKKFEFLERL